MVSNLDLKKATKQGPKTDSVFWNKIAFGQNHFWSQVLKVISIIRINKDSHSAAAPILNHIPLSGSEEELGKQIKHWKHPQLNV